MGVTRRPSGHMNQATPGCRPLPSRWRSVPSSWQISATDWNKPRRTRSGTTTVCIDQSTTKWQLGAVSTTSMHRVITCSGYRLQAQAMTLRVVSHHQAHQRGRRPTRASSLCPYPQCLPCRAVEEVPGHPDN
jgi:hypothetical protein